MSDKLFSLFPAVAGDELAAFREILHRLAPHPPQVLLFDGGTEEERRWMAKYWAACTLCPNTDSEGPCCSCQTCLRIAQDEYFDIMAYDGYIGQKEDEDNPGFYRAFTAENARSVKARLRDSPRGRYRIVLFTGIAVSRPEAPNALLKVLEEPSPTSLFILLTPAREQILPTLVSRSMCLTLPWSDPLVRDDDDIAELIDRFVVFFSDQGGFLSTVTAKSFMTQGRAQAFFNACQKSLIRVLAGRTETGLDRCLSVLPPASVQNLIQWLKEADEMVRSAQTPVTPSRVVEAFAMNVYIALGRAKGGRR